MAQVIQEFATHLGLLVSKRTVQRRLHGQAIYSHVAVQNVQNRKLVSRTGWDDDDVPEPLTRQYQTTGPAYFWSFSMKM